MKIELEKGQNPRKVLRRHRERGLKRYEYTYRGVADLAGLTLGSARAAEDLDMGSLASVAVFLMKRWVKGSRRVSPQELVKVLGSAAAVEQWKHRCPRVDLYWCGYPGCRATRVGRGLCEKHGGEGPTVVGLGDPPEFIVRTHEGDVPWQRLGVTHAMHHIDGNPWNNRPSNLKSPEKEKP